MENRLIKPVIPDIIRHLRYLVEFLQKEREEREAKPLLRTSPYYKWLAYSVIRRELFEEVRAWMRVTDRLYDSLIEVWRELKEYSLEGPIRAGLMHEVLYWVASLRAQSESDTMFFIVPIHEGIPRLKRSKKYEEEELHFRGDFSVFWGGANDKACAAVVDVKSHYGNIIGDKKLLQVASQFQRLGLQFFVASPRVTVNDFEYMKEVRYLLDLGEWWAHRPLRLDERTTGPYPEAVTPPWLLSSR